MDLPWLSSDETVTAWSRMSEERVEGVALCIQAARLESREKGNASMANSVQQSGDGAKKGKLAVLFEDLSIAQVIAGALAAATVFLLSSVIGVAGSLIGAAVGSILSLIHIWHVLLLRPEIPHGYALCGPYSQGTGFPHRVQRFGSAHQPCIA